MTPTIHAVSASAAPQGGGPSGVPRQPASPAAAASAAAGQVSAEADTADLGTLDQAVDLLAVHAMQAGAELDFRIDDDSGRVVVSVIDRSNGEILRQMPSEEALRIARHLQHLQDRSGAVIAALA